MRTSNLPYDKSSKESILKHAKKLLNQSLRKLYPEKIDKLEKAAENTGKGSLGKLVEKLHFRYEPNVSQEPDFPEAGVELKTSPIVRRKTKYSSKERLVLNMIDYHKIIEENFESSSFLKKNSLLLLMFYLYKSGMLNFDRIFKIIKLWDIPKDDYELIRSDWELIRNKVEEGKAHELSGGDTKYLEAARKGAGGGKDLTAQPNSQTRANRRAFAFKSGYVNSIVGEEIDTLDRAIKEDFDIDKETFEEYIQKKFKAFYGWSKDEIKGHFDLEYAKRSKHSSHLIAKAIIGINPDKDISEFEKAEIQMKTITLTKTGKPRESMSFKQIDYDEVVHERWEESYFYNEVVNRKFFFVIFKKDQEGNSRLHRVKFWNMPYKARVLAKKYWRHIKKQVEAGDFDNFWKISDKKIFHVRPKARNAKDLRELKDGRKVKKYAYWINQGYLYNEIINE